MDIQKAIEWQKAFKKTYNGMPQDVNETCDMAIEALEKQIPKKTVKDKYRRYCCPACGYIVFIHNPALLDEFVSHCENCGQALDWSETESEVES